MPIQDELWGLQNILNPIFRGYEPPQDDFDPWKAANSLYTPEHVASDRLTSLIDQMPIRRDPGMLQKVMAGVAGLQGPSAAPQQEMIMYGDYNRQLGDWKERLNPAVQAASFERAQNINERTLANQMITQERGYRNLERQIARDKTLETQGQTRINQAQQRIDQAEERIKIAEAAAKGPFKIDWGASLIINKDGSTVPIRADLFTTQERMALEQKYALERIQENAENRPGNRDRVTKEVRINPITGKPELGTYNLDTNTFTPAKDVEEKKPVEPGVRTPAQTELEKSRGITARALQAKVQDPDGKYVIIKNGRFEGITKPGVIFGPSIEQYNRLYKRIYGEEPTDIPQGTPNVQTQTPTGRIRVRRLNPQTGKIEEGSIPAAQLQQALKAGYELIK